MNSITSVLDRIGLSDGEQKVYLALLDLGDTTSGPIAEKSGVSASKVYQVIERLTKKGLVGESIQKGVKHFKAIHPKALLDYLQNQKEQTERLFIEAEKILPGLTAKYQEHQEDTEVQLYRGKKSFKNAFYSMLAELQSGESYYVIGANYGGKTDWTKNFFKHYHQERVNKDVKANILFQKSVLSHLDINQKGTNVKFLPEDFASTLQINIYNDTTSLVLMQDDPIVFTIKSKPVSQSFMQYFNSLWTQDVITLKGLDAAKQVLTQAVKEKELMVIGGGGYIYDCLPEWFNTEYVQLVKKHNHKWRNLIKPETRNHKVTKLPFAETKILPPGDYLPIVMWIYGDTVAHVLWEQEPIFILIKNKNVAEANRRYFDSMWQQDVLTWRGEEALKLLIDDIAEQGKDLYLIGAHGIMADRYPKLWQLWHTKTMQKGIHHYYLARDFARKRKFTNQPDVTAYFLPKDILGPMVIWIYGNIVCHVNWAQEVTVVRHYNEQMAQDYRTYFKYLTKLSKP